MTSVSEDRDFIAAVISTSLLEDAMAWIGMNLNPEDVFSEGDLASWAENNGYTEVSDE